MRPLLFLRILVGLLIWAAIVVGATRLLTEERGQETSTFRALAEYMGQGSAQLTVAFPTDVLIEVGATVHAEGSPTGTLEEEVIGEVQALLDEEGHLRSELFGWAPAVTLRLYDRSRMPIQEDATARLVQVPETFAWVTRTLLNEENMGKIAHEWNRTMLRHREEIFSLLTPVARNLIADVEELLHAELPAFLARHPDEARALGDIMEREVGGDKLVELFYDEIWPLAEKELTPVLKRVGGKIWEKFPLWTLSWNLAYQTLPLTADNHFDRAWKHFLESQVVPIIKHHAHDVLGSIREIGRQTLANEKVVAHLRETFTNLLSTPEFQSLAQNFVKEAILDNPRFHELMREHWQSAPVQLAVKSASNHLEPMLRRMGDIVLGTRREGISKEFARVLRAQILLKDRRRIIISPGSEDAPLLEEDKAIQATVEWEMVD